MKKNKELHVLGLTLTLLFLSGSMLSVPSAPALPMYYELRIYGVNTGKGAVIDKYLKEAFIPAMHRSGINTVGVFKPVETDRAIGKEVYVFIPYSTVEQYFKVEAALENDQEYLTAGKEFLEAPYNDPPFSRYESIFMRAFAFMPAFKTYKYDTPQAERIYELRSYESATEMKATNKIRMFNEGGEIAIFEKIGSNAVFYAQVLFGSEKPRLMYMTTYADMKSRDEHWNEFRNSPEWAALKAKQEYQNNTSKTTAFLLHPTDYSDF